MLKMATFELVLNLVRMIH